MSSGSTSNNHNNSKNIAIRRLSVIAAQLMVVVGIAIVRIDMLVLLMIARV